MTKNRGLIFQHSALDEPQK